MAFTQTDLPEPVAPAMRRWGVWARSMNLASPAMSLPRTTGISIFAALKDSASMSSRRETMERVAFGTSMPTACLPGIGATMRTLEAASRRAMLSARVVILESFTPGAGRISNIVMTGPLRMPVTSASILNSARHLRRTSAERRVLSSMIQYSPSG